MFFMLAEALYVWADEARQINDDLQAWTPPTRKAVA